MNTKLCSGNFCAAHVLIDVAEHQLDLRNDHHLQPSPVPADGSHRCSFKLLDLCIVNLNRCHPAEQADGMSRGRSWRESLFPIKSPRFANKNAGGLGHALNDQAVRHNRKRRIQIVQMFLGKRDVLHVQRRRSFGK